MTEPVVPSAARAVFTVLQSNGDVCVNVLNFRVNVTPLPALFLADWGSTLKTIWDSDIRPITRAEDKLVRIRTQDLTTAPYPSVDLDVSDAGTLSSGSQLPKQLAACISLRSTHAGRSGRGRIFIGCMGSTALNTDGSLTSSYIGSLMTYASDLVTGGTVHAVDWTLGVYSRKNGVLYDVVAHSVDGRADVQRRRANRRIF